jgi:hypothetical protein
LTRSLCVADIMNALRAAHAKGVSRCSVFSCSRGCLLQARANGSVWTSRTRASRTPSRYSSCFAINEVHLALRASHRAGLRLGARSREVQRSQRRDRGCLRHSVGYAVPHARCSLFSSLCSGRVQWTRQCATRAARASTTTAPCLRRVVAACVAVNACACAAGRSRCSLPYTAIVAF